MLVSVLAITFVVFISIVKKNFKTPKKCKAFTAGVGTGVGGMGVGLGVGIGVGGFGVGNGVGNAVFGDGGLFKTFSTKLKYF